MMHRFVEGGIQQLIQQVYLRVSAWCGECDDMGSVEQEVRPKAPKHRAELTVVDMKPVNVGDIRGLVCEVRLDE